MDKSHTTNAEKLARGRALHEEKVTPRCTCPLPMKATGKHTDTCPVVADQFKPKAADLHRKVVDKLWEDWQARNPEAKDALIHGKACVISNTLENGMEVKWIDPKRLCN